MSTRELLKNASERASEYLDTLDSRKVPPSEEAIAQLQQLVHALPETPTSPERVLAILDEIGSPATTATAGGRFFGFVIGSSLPTTLAANWLATAWDQNAGSSAISPIAGKLEEVSERWLLQILRLPAESGIGFVTGGTMANFTALAAARHAVLQREGWDVESKGLFGAPPINVVVSDEAHPTLHKSLGLLGLGRERVTRVPCDKQGRMQPDSLPRLAGPSIVCLQAGNVNTGAFDPAERIISKAHEAGAWVHVDGAFGLWARCSPTLARLGTALELCDSWATDAHKWLNVPYDCGMAIVRDATALRQAMSVSAAYLPSGEARVPADFTPELSRRARGVEVWAALYSLGSAGVAAMIERCCRHACRFADGLNEAGFEILNDIVLNQVLVSFGEPDRTLKVIKGIQEDGTCWCGGTVWQGRTAMRISVSSWATTEDDVEKSLAAIIRIAESAGC
jgi:glutamate/tyrosine decarboxylase-like PLP-dependent enzyme